MTDHYVKLKRQVFKHLSKLAAQGDVMGTDREALCQQLSAYVGYDARTDTTLDICQAYLDQFNPLAPLPQADGVTS